MGAATLAAASKAADRAFLSFMISSTSSWHFLGALSFESPLM
jgi:hypothetical protein